jgi:putative endonuclease
VAETNGLLNRRTGNTVPRVRIPASPQMKYFVYLLYSTSFNKTYTGQTNNLVNRLAYHNSGRVKSTKPFKPWVLIYSESFNSRSDAMKKEKWFKSKSGREKISAILDEYLKVHF